MRALFTQSWFEIRRTFRNRQFIFGSLIMPLAFYFLFIKLNGANLHVGGTSWKTYFLVSMSAFSCVGSCLFTLSSRIAHERTQGWYTLTRTTPLRASSYIIGKLVAQWCTMALSIIVVFVIGGLTQHVSLSVTQWLTAWLWLTFGALPFMSLGILVGVSMSLDATNVIANILYLGLAVLGGLWFPVQVMPEIMQHIAKWTPTWRYANVAWANVAGSAIHVTDIATVAGYTLLFALVSAWVLRGRSVQT